jgi:hypothetical protein
MTNIWDELTLAKRLAARAAAEDQLRAAEERAWHRAINRRIWAINHPLLAALCVERAKR